MKTKPAPHTDAGLGWLPHAREVPKGPGALASPPRPQVRGPGLWVLLLLIYRNPPRLAQEGAVRFV